MQNHKCHKTLQNILLFISNSQFHPALILVITMPCTFSPTLASDLSPKHKLPWCHRFEYTTSNKKSALEIWGSKRQRSCCDLHFVAIDLCNPEAFHFIPFLQSQQLDTGWILTWIQISPHYLDLSKKAKSETAKWQSTQCPHWKLEPCSHQAPCLTDS